MSAILKEPILSFRHAELKVRWAEKHINDLVPICNEIVQKHIKAGAVTYDKRTGNLRAESNRIPALVRLLAGDAIFSLRSALDCCWMGLKRAIDPKAEKATFPRATTLDELKGTLKKASVEQCFPGSDRLILDGIKSYQDGNETLWFVAQVDNWNKHNMLPLALSRTRLSGVFRTTNGMVTLIDDDQIISSKPVSFIGFGDGADVELHGEANVSLDIIISLGKPADERPLLPFLTSALQETDKAVKLLVSAFGKD